MTRRRSVHRRPSRPALAAAACVLLLTAPPAPAQPSGEVRAAPPAPAQPPGEAAPGAAAGPVRDWRHVQSPRARTELREREAGVADPARREDGQLRELDALSRQLAPGVPLPAPGLDPAQRR